MVIQNEWFAPTREHLYPFYRKDVYESGYPYESSQVLVLILLDGTFIRLDLKTGKMGTIIAEHTFILCHPIAPNLVNTC